MPTEIERKFLVASDAWRAAADRGRRLRQAYIAETERAAVRVRTEDDANGVLTIKSADSGLSRAEFEYALPAADARELFQLRQGSVVEKVRFTVPFADRLWEVDVYSGENEGLVLAEIELRERGGRHRAPGLAGPGGNRRRALLCGSPGPVTVPRLVRSGARWGALNGLAF